jgi:hypothetical protein
LMPVAGTLDRRIVAHVDNSGVRRWFHQPIGIARRESGWTVPARQGNMLASHAGIHTLCACALGEQPTSHPDDRG